MFVSTIGSINEATSTETRADFVRALNALPADQIVAVARIRFGARIKVSPRVSNSKREALIASIVALFDATASFTR